jgi:RNA polymerase sigma-70 factor (ECF subfamily)
MLVNSCMDVLRRVRRWSVEVELTHTEHPDEGDIATWIADRDAIERAFSRLGPELRAVVVLHYYLGLSLPDAADALGVPVGTAKSRLHRALRKMRVAIAPPALGRINAAGGPVR